MRRTRDENRIKQFPALLEPGTVENVGAPGEATGSDRCQEQLNIREVSLRAFMLVQEFQAWPNTRIQFPPRIFAISAEE
jgi:hypothetical protein